MTAARDFLQGLGTPVLAVPGNHDIPLFDVARRLLRPLDRYRQYIHADDNPFYVDAELAVLGLNTARRTALAGDGRISLPQIEVLRQRFAPLPPGLVRVLVTHHPFVPAPSGPAHTLVGRGLEGLQAAEAASTNAMAHSVPPAVKRELITIWRSRNDPSKAACWSGAAVT